MVNLFIASVNSILKEELVEQVTNQMHYTNQVVLKTRSTLSLKSVDVRLVVGNLTAGKVSYCNFFSID